VQTQIGKWGNSLAVRIPLAYVREAHLDEGMTVELSITDGRLIVTPVRPTYSLEELVAGITDENRHAETDWGEPVGNEAW
jgi:antitoxin MazE